MLTRKSEMAESLMIMNHLFLFRKWVLQDRSDGSAVLSGFESGDDEIINYPTLLVASRTAAERELSLVRRVFRTKTCHLGWTKSHRRHRYYHCWSKGEAEGPFIVTTRNKSIHTQLSVKTEADQNQSLKNRPNLSFSISVHILD